MSHSEEIVANVKVQTPAIDVNSILKRLEELEE
jgi:hypothetical protein